MSWIVPLVVLVAFFVLVEWTSRPRGSAKDVPSGDVDIDIPRPRRPAPGWTTSSPRRPD